MKTSIKNLSETKIQLTIAVDKTALDDAQKVAITKLSKDVKVQGFRKGKVPANVAIKNIDPSLLQEETMNNAISKSVAEAFVENKIQVLERPAVEVKKFVPGETLEFTAEAEILPAVKLGDYKKLKVATEKVTVTAKEVDEMLERIRVGLAEKSEVTRAAKMDDDTIIDFVGKRDGVAFDGGTGNDYNLKLGSNSFIPGFEEGIVGKKPGETFDIDLEFPKDYHSADLKGAIVTFTTTLKSIKEAKLPEVDDAFAAKAGPFKTVAEMKTDLKREITDQKEREAKEKLKDVLVTKLIEVSKVPVPEVLVDDQMKSIEQDFSQNLMYQGITIEQYMENKEFKDKDDWYAREVKPAAEKRVKAGLVLAELSKVEKIDATADELAEHINMYKEQYGKNPEALKQFDNPEVHRDIANHLITEKTVERLVELNK